MASCSSLFITAKNADVKLVNRLLLTLRDWEFGEEPSWDNFALPPLQEFSQNEWEGATIEEIETVILATDREKESAHGKVNGPNNLLLFLVLDDQGVTDRTVILFERAIGDADGGDAEAIDFPARFNKLRTPWTNAYTDWCNLDIANIGFSEMCDYDGADKGKSETDGVWWTYMNAVGEITSDENKKKRDAVIKELGSLGLA
ncbi:hypothetical protein ColLi_04207 [Colletotrichum liriopes]|uniref:Uncharacterized protein n=1 Tax=Colletotrichum liriopes TaxID=708192 RepID=A0AA37LQM5_9PEZI|nr:hypothetical protein ColLi_04207 [Colletotrichum liriopes]